MKRRALLPAACAGAFFVAARKASAGQVAFNNLIPGGSGVVVPAQSFAAQRFASTVEQEYDFSCGSAALATLLTYSYNHPVTEQQVFASMFNNGDKKLIEEQGFSLLDIKEYLARTGYESAGFRAPLNKLAEVSLPAIVLINESGYNHFVVIRGFRDGEVMLADPAVGMKISSVTQFEKQWSGIFFIILSDVSMAQKKFQDDNNWQYVPQSPYQIARFAVTMATLQQVTIRNVGAF